MASSLFSSMSPPHWASFSLCSGKDTLQFCNTGFEKLLEVLGFLC